jgi:hypothetical protein
MVDIEVGEFTGGRRFDSITAASVVLTVDAALFLVLAVVGVPFLLFVFGDDDTGTWQHMGPLLAWWVAAAVLGVACAAAVVRSFGSGGVRARRLGAGSAIATVIAVSTLIVVTLERAPLLAPFGMLLAIANVAAARVLSGRGVVDLAGEEPEIVFIEGPGAGFEEQDGVEEQDGFEEEAEPRVTVDLPRTGPGRAVPSAARRRLRAKAAMQTHAGVRLIRRPRR